MIAFRREDKVVPKISLIHKPMLILKPKNERVTYNGHSILVDRLMAKNERTGVLFSQNQTEILKSNNGLGNKNSTKYRKSRLKENEFFLRSRIFFHTPLYSLHPW